MKGTIEIYYLSGNTARRTGFTCPDQDLFDFLEQQAKAYLLERQFSYSFDEWVEAVELRSIKANPNDWFTLHYDKESECYCSSIPELDKPVPRYLLYKELLEAIRKGHYKNFEVRYKI